MRSLAHKYSVFTVLLIGWVSCTFFALDYWWDSINWLKVWLLTAAVALVAGAVSRFTHYVLAKPLVRLGEGIRAVREGRLEPIQVSRTGDEVEYLGESLNAMIEVLKASRSQIREYQETLERRIQQRTEALEEAMQQALAASRAKSEFLANISHELRTPMSGVLGMIDIVLDQEMTSEQREDLETAKGCANGLLALLNDILDLSKIEAGKMTLEAIPFDIRKLTHECVRSMALGHLNRTKKIDLRIEIDASVPKMLVGDPLRIRQILTNLVGNAVKFTDQGWVELRVWARRHPSCSEVDLAVEVADTGPGIPAEKLQTIFDEFTQVDGSISRKYGGSGLGLAIARRLAEMHGGSIQVKSELGKGSTFRVELRCQRAPLEERNARTGAGENSATQGPVRGNGARILIVEDNLVNQKVVAALLGKQGYRIQVANNGHEALERIHQSPYDLVLMDIQMPGMDGIETASAIRRNAAWSRLPIIAMTAHAMNGDRERCLAAGMDDYLSKPVNPSHLLDVVSRYLSRERSPAQADAPAAPWVVGRKTGDQDSDLLCGMTLLFLQLAPDRLQKLQSAAERGDVTALRSLAQKLEMSAERIGAEGVATSARGLSEVIGGQQYPVIVGQLANLEQAIRRLERDYSSVDRSGVLAGLSAGL